jgi:tetratricopeptide (TPR) repeat protein
MNGRLTMGIVPAGSDRFSGRWLALGCLVVLSLCLPAAVQAQDKPSGELTPEQQRMRNRADALNEEAVKLYQQGRYPESTKLLQEVLRLVEGVYPKDKYPQGHPDLAMTLHNVGFLLQDQREYAKALPYFEKALAMRQRLYPTDKYPRGHPDLASSLNNLGGLRQALGDYGKALSYFEQAVAMYARLYPRDEYPQGHPHLAISLNNLGGLRQAQGEYAKALPYWEQVLAMRERLYPRDRYPRGHPDLAQSLNNLGFLLRALGDYAKALSYYEQALTMNERLYPRDRYPPGHPDLAISLNNLGGLLRDQGEYTRTLPYLEKALAMCERLYPRDRYPRGHPHLATSLNNLGALLQVQGDYDKALPYFEKALAMRQRLYPKDRCPQGHPHLATSLGNLGGLLRDQGDYAKALPYHEKALAMNQRLYPKDRYPQGHSDLASSLGNLGVLLQAQGEYAKALPYLKKAQAMNQRLYPKGHPDLALSLSNLGSLLQAQGEYAKALPYYEEALAMRQRLYPTDKYPRGNPHLATSLNNLGTLLWAQGEYAKALSYLKKGLAMQERLYPEERFRQGHPHLAQSLNNLGGLLQTQGEYARALPYLEKALAMRQRLYPKDMYPQGHPHLAQNLNILGALLWRQGEYAKALTYFEKALAMRERLYPEDKYPGGHPHLALSLNHLGSLLNAQGEYARALSYYEKNLAMNERLYPKEKYPQGHPDLAMSLGNLGFLLLAQGEHAKALTYFEKALAMNEELDDAFLTIASEVEALNRPLVLPVTLGGYLSVAQRLPKTEGPSYAHVWRGKGAVARVMERRHRALALTDDPTCRDLARDLIETRQTLARLLLSPTGSQSDYQDRVQKLTGKKEDLERQLARKLSAFQKLQERDRLTHADLLKKLPARTSFVDFLRYYHFEQDPKVRGRAGEKLTASYLAYVLRPGQPVRRVELGPAQPIEDAVNEWRRDIKAGKASTAATLRKRVWGPLAEHLPGDTETVFLAPDGALTALPWVALPGPTPGKVLLEEPFTLALVPHGRFLLERLLAKGPADRAAGLLLAVGAVQYDKAPRLVEKPKDEPAPDHGPALGSTRISWKELAGTERELRNVLDLADQRQPLVRRGDQAGARQLLLDLPKARWAHLATHGFFADKHFRSALQLDTKDYQGRLDPVRGYVERVGVGARNPLVLSGLVLAGANVPGRDDGILTAEALADLRLHNLDLAVLSACETGLGDVAGGEGAFGLQRAFHIAGAKNVVASLWRVDDEATAALMALFYRKLWREGKAPPQALKEAQLALYRNPQSIPALAKAREPDFDKEFRRIEEAPKPRTRERAGVRQWAGFVVSGIGR